MLRNGQGLLRERTRRGLTDHDPLFSMNLEKALRYASLRHREQRRRGSGVPYFQHVAAVGMILDRQGFVEDVVIAGVLHDVVEDTDASLNDVSARFGPEVADLVATLSERKRDEQGQKRPWIDRKTEHLEVLDRASIEARAITLADKLHNLTSILQDLHEGRRIWDSFHADRRQVLWYYRSVIERCGTGEPRLEALADECRRILSDVEAFGPE